MLYLWMDKLFSKDGDVSSLLDVSIEEVAGSAVFAPSPAVLFIQNPARALP